MPANPSSWAWKLAFKRRSANGERFNISRHQRTVSSSSVASGTTSLTSPISSASSAEYILQRNHISFAFFGPTRLVRTDAPKPPSKLPTFGPTCPNLALSAAMVRSHTTCRTWPPPTAYPATIATTGLGQRRIWTCRSVTWKRPTDSPPGVRRGESGSSRYPASPRTFWSPPEQKASGPSPVRIMTPVSWSSRASSRAFCISMTVSGRNAFLTSGRFMVIFAIPSAFSYLMSSNTPADSHSIVVIAGLYGIQTPLIGGTSSQELLFDNAVGSLTTSCTLFMHPQTCRSLIHATQVTSGPMFSAETAEAMRALVERGAFGIGVFETDDINGDYERLSRQDVEFVSPPEERFYGTEAIVKDNSGNWFSLTQSKR